MTNQILIKKYCLKNGSKRDHCNRNKHEITTQWKPTLVYIIIIWGRIVLIYGQGTDDLACLLSTTSTNTQYSS